MEFINEKIEELENHLKDLNYSLRDNEFLTQFERQHLFTKTIEIRAQIRTLKYVLKAKKYHDLEIASTTVQIKMYQLHEVEEAFDRWLNAKDDKIPFTDFLRGKQTFPENKIS
ncbi:MULTISPECIES: hypothetical protein [unclassified Empedobacter]|uniref:hypothetical protein n=1 Tax=unclassified Empedobacter TaxID=2643773 RepID=UPI0025BD23AF|nr:MULTISPECIES: hypothetical protein [unclassified Empedobacter]